jgi:hypothetical protein
MATVKFSHQEDLNTMQAEIYLLTGKKFNKQEILEAIFSLEKNNVHKIIERLTSKDNEPTEDPLLAWLKTPVDGKEDTDSVNEHDVIQ